MEPNLKSSGAETLSNREATSHTEASTVSLSAVRKDQGYDSVSHVKNKDQPPAGSENGVSTGIDLDEIKWMRERIEILEEKAAGNLNSGEATEREKSQPELTPEFLEFKRMEECLYRHRKEWEAAGGPGQWRMSADLNSFLNKNRDYMSIRRGGPWNYNWPIIPSRDYKRPDVFDKAQIDICESKEDEAPDDFDRAIDFESRRARLRKGFEWEMDRLYLVEEIENRRRAQEEKKRQEAIAKDTAEGPSTQAESSTSQEAVVPEPKFNRVDWYAFRRFAVSKTKACEIDILMGEPMIQDAMSSYGVWFGYSRSAVPKRARGNVGLAVRKPEEAPLPERIRIHSGFIPRILAKMLDTDTESLMLEKDAPVVFIRPFKALVYCEEGLRELAVALEKRFTVSSDVAAERYEQSSSQDSKTQEPSQATTSHDKTPPVAGEEEEDDDYEDDKVEKEQDSETWTVDTLKHVLCLLEFLDTDIKAKRSYLEQTQRCKVFFSDLWHLFRPGIEVIANDGKQAYRVIQVSSAPHRVLLPWQRFRESSNQEGKKQQPPFSLTCVYVDFDGKSFGPVSKTFEFKRFEGQRDITSLEVYPLRAHPIKRTDFGDEEWQEIEALPPSDRGEVYRKRLIQRGKKFLDMASIKHMYYAGPTLGIRDEVESQVVIDFETAFAVEDKEQQEWKPKLESVVSQTTSENEDEEATRCQSLCCQQDQVYDDNYVDVKQREKYINNLLLKSENEENQALLAVIPRPSKDLQIGDSHGFVVSEDDLVIMSYRVFGFVLRTRRWAQLDLSFISDVHPPGTQLDTGRNGWENTDEESSTAFERLVLEEKHKEMIVSLVSQHFRDKLSTSDYREQVDIVRGKGKGLILLLHGAPGVGKTSTAEGVAELFRKPLFQITCGDLGTTAHEVEAALETTFALASRWDCILLLDEADVFLSQRTKEDFQRNGLVAVFLRVMEYYAGILFLTTNRVGDFDEAFTSRIHVSLYYPELSVDKTVGVFRLNLDLIERRFQHKDRRIQIDKIEIVLFASKHFNDHPDARWNGRQIRNACQTALAIAEFEAQGKNHKAVEKPGAVVTLSVRHFEYVRDAYVDFTRYINKLHGTNASRRAQEEKLRTIWNSDSNPIATRGFDQKALFTQAARDQPPVSYPPRSPGLQPSSIHPSGREFQQVPGQYMRYSEAGIVGSQMAGYSYQNQMSAQEQPVSTGRWDPSMHHHGQQSTHAMAPNAHQAQISTQPPPQVQHINPPWFQKEIADMYEPSGPPTHESDPSRAITPTSRMG